MKFNYLFSLLIFSVLISACSKERVITQDNYEVVDLPDGSIVFLNHYSELEYIEAFNQRRVAISGECYFSVEASDKSFTVTGELGEVEVLGTEFSVKSDIEDMKVEVESGSVQFTVEDHSEKLSKGEMASYQKGDNSIKTGKASNGFKKWMAKLRIEFKRLDKKLNDEAKGIEEELNEKAKEIEKEANKIGKELEDVGDQIGKSIKKITD
ncbi:FecR domain-containing protein [Marivirga salinae]|uniref:FecR domain-containing protein n=1 Tax=Marivirga salinarum TaxID=3059078 RepID=A0AA49GGI7_9BACT|nr:FecR domain-containing protein [Marivirga sp. BDSF4-3]WKK75352.2 FecR domain-containing protein [Marivirga sp. BDSF4-3]